MSSNNDNISFSKKKSTILPIVFVAILVIFVLIIIFLPTFFLKRAINKEFDPQSSVLKSIRAKEVSVSIFLDTVSVGDLVLEPSASPTLPLKISEIKITKLKGLKLLKTILGFEDKIFDVLAEGEMVVKNVTNLSSKDQLFKLKIDTLSLAGLVLDLEPADPNRLDNIRFNSLKFSNLNINFADQLLFSSEGLSFFDLYDSVLGGLVIGSLDYNNPSNATFKSLSLNNASVSNIDLITLITELSLYNKGLYTNLNLQSMVGLSRLVGSIQSLDLSSLSVMGQQDELLFLRRALLDGGQNNDSQSSAVHTFLLEDLTLDLVEFDRYWPDTPLALAIWESLDQKTTANLRATSRQNDSGLMNSLFDLKIKDKADLSFSISLANLPTEINQLKLLLALPKVSLGPGELAIVDHSFLPHLSQALSQHLFKGRPTSESLLPHLSKYLASLVDPKPGSRPLNQEILEIELNQFLTNPQSLILSFNPEPGYPFSLFEQGGDGLKTAVSQVISGQTSVLAEKYKYAILSELNLNLAVNGRAPVDVYLTRSRSTTPPDPVNP
jgi:hypothetical protein